MVSDSKIKARRLVRGIFAIAVSLALVSILLCGVNTLMQLDVVAMTKGWNVSFRGKEYADVDINRFRFPENVKRGEAVAITNEIPDSIGRDMILSFGAEYSYVRVYVAGRCVYSYMQEPNQPRGVPGCGIHVVSLPENCAGRICEIDLFAGIDNAFSVLPDFDLIPSRLISSSYMNRDIYTNLAGFSMFMVGIILFLASFILFVIKKIWIRSFLLGNFSFAMGIWSLCRADAVELFSSAFAANTRLEHLCIYFAVLPLIAMTILVRRVGERKRQRVCVGIGCVLITAFFIAALVLEYTQFVNVVYLYTVFHVVFIISASLIIYGTAQNREKWTREYRIQNCGIYIVAIGTAADIVRYYTKDLIVVNSRALYHSQMPFVAIAYLLITLYAYLAYLNDHFMAVANEQALEKIAYTDVLTGLHNRAWCNRKFEELSQRKGVNYQIISFDVNGLKKVNDTMGHSAGDSLLRDCARILSSCFEDTGHVIRMGGDEFLVLFISARQRYIKRGLKKMERLEASYGMRRDYQIKISYGMSSSDEEKNMTPETVYQRADSRMYQMKKETRYAH